MSEASKAANRAWYARNKEVIRNRRRGPIFREKAAKAQIQRYGISLARYIGLLIEQDYKCAICGIEPETSRLEVDHDHSCCSSAKKACGKCIRGLLCKRCNHILGEARDNPRVLIEGVKYLLAGKAKRVEYRS